MQKTIQTSIDERRKEIAYWYSVKKKYRNVARIDAGRAAIKEMTEWLTAILPQG